MTSHWDAIDAAAEREGTAKRNAFHTSAVAMKTTRGGVWRTTRGAGVGAAKPPASGFSDLREQLPDAA